METVAELALRLDGCLAHYEPLALIAAPLQSSRSSLRASSTPPPAPSRTGASSPSPPSRQRPRRALLPSLLLDYSRGHACLLACTSYLSLLLDSSRGHACLLACTS